MDLAFVSEVKLTDDEGRVNKLLAEGWVLLSVAGGKNEEGYPLVWYSLGFPGRAYDEDEEPKPEML